MTPLRPIGRLGYIARHPRRALVRASNLLSAHMGRFEEVVWIIGLGRSGTTWVRDVINWDHAFRTMFEPFHPVHVHAMGGMRLHEYIRPSRPTSPFDKLVRSVLTGTLSNEHVEIDNDRFWYDRLLVKDIFANLLAPYAQRRFPNVKIVLLIRNPFAVAVSRRKKEGWIWMEDPAALLEQEDLYEDHLEPFEGLIRSVGDDFVVRQVILWAIVNHVPLKLLDPQNARVLLYEDLHDDPDRTLARLLEFTRGDSSDLSAAMGRIDVPSRSTGGEGNVNLGKSPVTAWQEEVSASQIERGIELLAPFGLDGLYGTSPRPSAEAARGLTAQGLRIQRI